MNGGSFSLFLILIFLLAGCSILYTRPVQEMSDTTAALRAAREVQADTLAPEFYRQANEWFSRAKHEYKFKNFKLAKEYADRARGFAEQAELESLRNGGIRSDLNPPEAAPPPPPPYPYPEKAGVSLETYEQNKTQEAAAKNMPPAAGTNPSGGANPGSQGAQPASAPGAPLPYPQPSP